MTENCWARTGMVSFVFVVLLLLFNWPLMTIPGPGTLLTWLFAAWALAIVLLGLVARGVTKSCRYESKPPDASGSGEGDA